jgi:hypothetical protein
MFVQALRVEWQPDPESLRRIRRYGPIRVKSEVVHCPGVRNRFIRSHRISCVVHNHFCRHQETVNKTTANLHQAAVNVHRGDFFVIPHSQRSHPPKLSSQRRHLGVLHRQVAVSATRGQLLMLYTPLLRMAENLNRIPMAAENRSGICKPI